MRYSHLNSRKRNRLLDYDYSQSGWYFVTICIKNREECFGEIKNEEMILNEFGKNVKDQWLWLEQQYGYIKLDEYIIMPNHVHGIVVIENNYHDNRRDRSRPVPTLNTLDTENTDNPEKIKSLPELMGAFKTTSSKLIHQNGLELFNWQRSFYDHIIRDEKSLNNIRAYINNNPLKWALDRNNQENLYY